MSANLSALAYLLASVLFIMALRGLSSPETARKGNIYGMTGMAIAAVTTVVDPNVSNTAASCKYLFFIIVPSQSLLQGALGLVSVKAPDISSYK